MFARGTIVGYVTKVKKRPSGSAIAFLRVSNAKDTKVRGVIIDTWFSNIVMVRIPKRVMSKQGDKIKKGMGICLDCNIQGMRRVVGGEDLYYCEISANTVFEIEPYDPQEPMPEEKSLASKAEEMREKIKQRLNANNNEEEEVETIAETDSQEDYENQLEQLTNKENLNG